MPLVRLFSDLHLEFDLSPLKKISEICSLNRTKYTILAGDITNFKKREFILTELVSTIKPHTDHIIYILGNHEYYELGSTKTHEVIDIYRELSNRLGITFLEDDHIETDDFIFYGATMWSKLNDDAYSQMADHFFLKKQEILDIHEKSKLKLDKFLNGFGSGSGSEKPLIVITHHLPSFKLIDKVYERYGSLNTGFASELDYLIRYPVRYFLFGHSHKPNDIWINGVRLLCNPGGYPKELILKPLQDCTF